MKEQSTRRQFVKRSLGWIGGIGIAERCSRFACSAAAPTEKYQLSCQTLPYRAFSLGRALEGIQAAGYKYVMPYSTHEGKEVFGPSLSAAQRLDLKKMIADHGLTAHMSFVGLGLDLKTEKGQDQYRRELDLYREFDIKTVVGVGPWYYVKFPDQPKDPHSWKQECDLFYKGLQRVMPHAEKLGITVALKPHTGITATAKACLEIMRREVSKNLRICWDAGNVSYYEGIHPDPDFPALAPHVRAVCIKDHRGARASNDFPVPGEGQVDHELMFNHLFGAGFRGPLAVERVDGTMDATKMPAELIDRRIRAARDFLAPLLEKCVARAGRTAAG